MSVSSRTPDDKLHRYLQRIQKLVGNRSKSPVSVIKSRNSRIKSPLNIKTIKLDNYLKYQLSLKTIHTFFYYHNKKLLQYSFNSIRQFNEQKNKSVYESQYSIKQSSIQYVEKSVKIKQNKKQPLDKTLQVRFLIKPLKLLISRQLAQSFQIIKNTIKQKQKPIQIRVHKMGPKAQQQVTPKDIKKMSHRKSYSQIYAQTLQKPKFKSPSPLRSQDYQFQTPPNEQRKNLISKVLKNSANLALKLMVSIVQKSICRYYTSFVSQLKSNQLIKSYQLSKNLQQQKKRDSIIKKQKQVEMLEYQTSQALKLKAQIVKLKQQIKQKDSDLENQKKNMMSFQGKVKNEINYLTKQIQLYQKQKRKYHLPYILMKISQKKTDFYKHRSFEFIKNNLFLGRAYEENIKTKTINLFRTIKNINAKKLQQSFARINLNAVINNMNTAQMNQKSIAYSHHSIRSLNQTKSVYSAKYSNTSNAKQISQNFDQFANKINKAFQLRNTMCQIYAYVFQKIDYSALLSLTIQKSIIQVANNKLKESFKQIFYYSINRYTLVNQSIRINESSDSHLLLNEKQNMLFAKTEKIVDFLQKMDRKMLISKIQAYRQFIFLIISILKISYQKSKQKKKSQLQSIVSEKTLKRQISQFLLQRKKMKQKTIQTWQKTKQLLRNSSLSQSKYT